LRVRCRSFRTTALTSVLGNGFSGSGGALVADYLIRLWAFLSLNDVKFYFVAFFQTFISIDLDGAVMNKNVRSIVSSDKSVPFGVVEPLDLSGVLRHETYPSLKADSGWGSYYQPAFLRDAGKRGLVFLFLWGGRVRDSESKQNNVVEKRPHVSTTIKTQSKIHPSVKYMTVECFACSNFGYVKNAPGSWLEALQN
jgi:hypothetical protein